MSAEENYFRWTLVPPLSGIIVIIHYASSQYLSPSMDLVLIPGNPEKLLKLFDKKSKKEENFSRLLFVEQD